MDFEFLPQGVEIDVELGRIAGRERGRAHVAQGPDVEPGQFLPVKLPPNRQSIPLRKTVRSQSNRPELVARCGHRVPFFPTGIMRRPLKTNGSIRIPCQLPEVTTLLRQASRVEFATVFPKSKSDVRFASRYSARDANRPLNPREDIVPTQKASATVVLIRQTAAANAKVLVESNGKSHHMCKGKSDVWLEVPDAMNARSGRIARRPRNAFQPSGSRSQSMEMTAWFSGINTQSSHFPMRMVCPERRRTRQPARGHGRTTKRETRTKRPRTAGRPSARLSRRQDAILIFPEHA